MMHLCLACYCSRDRRWFALRRGWTKSTYSTKTTLGAIVRLAMATREFLNVRDAARALGVHENTVRNWEARGLLRAVRLPGSGFRRFAVEDVERHLAHALRVLAWGSAEAEAGIVPVGRAELCAVADAEGVGEG